MAVKMNAEQKEVYDKAKHIVEKFSANSHGSYAMAAWLVALVDAKLDKKKGPVKPEVAESDES